MTFDAEDFRRRCIASGVPAQMLDDFIEDEAERFAIAAANAMLARIMGQPKAPGSGEEARGHAHE